MKRTLMAGIAGLLAFTTACGDDDDAASDSASTTSIAEAAGTADAATTTGATEATDLATTTTSDMGTDETDGDDDANSSDVPQRIVSLAPTHTETLFAIGAGEQVIAVDDYSNYPDEALDLPADLSGFDPNVEAISEYDPDLVVLSRDEGIVEQLDQLDIDTWVGDSAQTFDDVYDQITQLGETTGHEDAASDLVEQMQADIDELTGDLPAGVDGLSVYHEVSDDYFSAGSASFVGQVYDLFGLENIAGEELFPQLNAETIVSADPDLIFIAHSGGTGVDEAAVAARDGWQDMTAVQNGAIFLLDDDIASRWGPRVVDYVSDVRDALDTVAGASDDE